MDRETGKTIASVKAEETTLFTLPGRQWGVLLGPENVQAKNMTLGLSVFPAGSAPGAHIHPVEEEMIYVVSGLGRLVGPAVTVALEPGVAVYVPPGVEHATIAEEGGEPLRLIMAFSPAVVAKDFVRRAAGSDPRESTLDGKDGDRIWRL